MMSPDELRESLQSTLRDLPLALAKTGPVEGVTVLVRGTKGIAVLGDDPHAADLIDKLMPTKGRDYMETYTITYDEIEHETDDAIMLVFDARLVWLPKSRITLDRDEKSVELEQWLLEEKGIEDLVE